MEYECKKEKGVFQPIPTALNVGQKSLFRTISEAYEVVRHVKKHEHDVSHCIAISLHKKGRFTQRTGQTLCVTQLDPMTLIAPSKQTSREGRILRIC
jgi:hypothetical protein